MYLESKLENFVNQSCFTCLYAAEVIKPVLPESSTKPAFVVGSSNSMENSFPSRKEEEIELPKEPRSIEECVCILGNAEVWKNNKNNSFKKKIFLFLFNLYCKI